MHQTLENQYRECDCETCRVIASEARQTLSDGKANDFSKVQEAANDAFKKLYELGKYNPKDLQKIKEFDNLVRENAGTLNTAISHEVPEEMKTYLEKDVFIFSGLKTHAQLAEARSYLKDESGNIQPYHQFEQKVSELNDKYNRNYLEAEYEFAVQSSQSAANWANLQSNTDRYWLEYRTAGDERVRAEHAALNGTCLPADDDFWDSYYPPNGWRCRCVAIEVLARDYELSDSKEAMKKGEAATTQISKSGKNSLEMFRFNPGKEKRVFPPGNAYEKVVGADKVETKKIEKPVVYNNKTLDELERDYRAQNINSDNEKLVMSEGYVATSNAFTINEKLRAGKFDELSDHNKKVVKALDELIKNNKLKDNLLLYRNVRYDFIESTFGVKPNGTITETIDSIQKSGVRTYSDKGFTSVSAIKSENAFQTRPVHLEIRAKKNSNAFIANNFSESEIILKREQKMKIVDALEENGKIKIILETD